MGDEAEIAGRTDRIARAMNGAESKLGQVADALGDTDRVLEQRFGEARSLGATANRVERAEQEADLAGRQAKQSQARPDMERWLDADDRVRTAFGHSQVAAGNLASKIGTVQGGLNELRDDLATTTDRLDQALDDVDALDRLPEYGESPETSGLRTHLENLQTLVKNAGNDLGGHAHRLDTARQTALGLERASLEVGGGRHSDAVRSASKSVQDTVMSAGAGLRETRDGLAAQKPEIEAMTKFGIGTANAAAAANKEAEQLAKSVQAAANPTPVSAQQAAGSAQQDLRHQFNGPSQDSGVQR
jgi:F0F1-type ATP synthase membrane subunit b/b'